MADTPRADECEEQDERAECRSPPAGTGTPKRALPVTCRVLGLTVAVAVVAWACYRWHRTLNWSGLQTFDLQDRPEGDARSYKAVVLSNGLKVLSIQDPRSLSAAFAVAVSAGSFDDPEDLPGLMHFCEHMLFLGTNKYPDPFGFANFVDMNGGSHNAYTAEEVTVYFAEVAGAAAPEALDRLADFFRAPLLNETFQNMEVHAIDSEHAKNVQDPDQRVYEVLASLANPASPVGRFKTGSMQTLSVEPKNAGKDPVKALRRRFETLYCPPKMHLVTFGPSSCDEQLRAVQETFGQIPLGQNQCAQSPRRSFAEPPAWPTANLGKWVDIAGVTPHAQLWLSFMLPDVRAHYHSQPLQYIEWVLNYDGEGSLFQSLRDEFGLAYTLGVDDESTSAGTVLQLTFGLTDRGHSRPDLVLDVLFAYLAKLRRNGIDLKLHQSLLERTRIIWDWREPRQPISTASLFAERMTRIKMEDIMWGDDLTRRRDLVLEDVLMRGLVPSAMNVALVVPRNGSNSALLGEVPGVQVRHLPHYDVRHTIRELSDVFPTAAGRWTGWLHSRSEAGPAAELAERLGLDASRVVPRPPGPVHPPPILLDHASASMTAASSATTDRKLFGAMPEPLVQRSAAAPAAGGSADSDTWYREGWVSNPPKQSPRLSINVLLRPMMREIPEVSARDTVRLSLFGSLISEEIEPLLTDLKNDGGSCSVSVGSSGLWFSFGGFEPMLAPTVEKVLNLFSAHISLPKAATRYARVYQLYREQLGSYELMPVSYAVADRNLVLTRGQHSRADLLAELENTTLESIAPVLRERLLTHQLRLTALAMGNLNRSEALDVVNSVARSVRSLAESSTSCVGCPVELITPIVDPAQPIEIRKRNPRPGDPNDAVVVSIVVGITTVRSRVVLSVLGSLLGQVAFDELRTVMQLGYVASGGTVKLSNVDILSCVVQGSVKGADDMAAAVHWVYTKAMPERLASLSTEQFDMYKSSFRDMLLQKPFHTSGEVGVFWEPISSQSGCFSLRHEMLEYLDHKLTKAELIDEWRRIVTPHEGFRKTVTVKYFAGSGPPPPRPSEMDAAKAWREQKLPSDAVELLLREHQRTLVFADAGAAARVGATYFPMEQHCGPHQGADSAGSAGAGSALQVAATPTMRANRLARLRPVAFAPTMD